MAEVKLENDDRKVLVDDADYERVAAKKWYLWPCGQVMATARHGRKTTLGRFILGVRGRLALVTLRVDGLDYRRSNLRLTARGDMPKNAANTSGYKGVCRRRVGPYRRRPWDAVIRKKHIGSFSTAEEAARAYDARARELFGADAYLNFPESA